MKKENSNKVLSMLLAALISLSMVTMLIATLRVTRASPTDMVWRTSLWPYI